MSSRPYILTWLNFEQDSGQSFHPIFIASRNELEPNWSEKLYKNNGLKHCNPNPNPNPNPPKKFYSQYGEHLNLKNTKLVSSDLTSKLQQYWPKGNIKN